MNFLFGPSMNLIMYFVTFTSAWYLANHGASAWVYAPMYVASIVCGIFAVIGTKEW